MREERKDITKSGGKKNNKTLNGKKNAEGHPYLFAAFALQNTKKWGKRITYLILILNCDGETRGLSGGK